MRPLFKTDRQTEKEGRGERKRDKDRERRVLVFPVQDDKPRNVTGFQETGMGVGVTWRNWTGLGLHFVPACRGWGGRTAEACKVSSPKFVEQSGVSR